VEDRKTSSRTPEDRTASEAVRPPFQKEKAPAPSTKTTKRNEKFMRREFNGNPPTSQSNRPRTDLARLIKNTARIVEQKQKVHFQICSLCFDILQHKPEERKKSMMSADHNTS
jgi:hypothetical protein